MMQLSTIQYDLNTSEAPVKMFEYFLASDNKQTFFYTGDIASLKHLIRAYGEDLSKLEEETKTALHNMYSAYYNDVTIDVVTEPIDNGSLHKILFNIKIINELGVQVDVLREFTLEEYRNSNSIETYKRELL